MALITLIQWNITYYSFITYYVSLLVGAYLGGNTVRQLVVSFY